MEFFFLNSVEPCDVFVLYKYTNYNISDSLIIEQGIIIHLLLIWSKLETINRVPCPLMRNLIEIVWPASNVLPFDGQHLDPPD